MTGAVMIVLGYVTAVVAMWPWGLLVVAAHIAILVLLAQKRR